MTFEEIRQLALSFPGVEEHFAFGRPTFRINDRFVACVAKIDADTLVLKLADRLEREYFIVTKPDTFYATPHYEEFEAVLIRMPKVERADLLDLFEQAWRAFASKRRIERYQANSSDVR